MKHYDEDDEVTFYFVIYENDGSPIIQGWTDDKELAKSYLDFHSSKKLKMKSIKGDYRNTIVPILNESANDEIQLVNIFIHKKDYGSKQVTVPMTMTESMFINSEETSFFSSRIDYTTLNIMVPFLKNKYQRILKHIHLMDIINQTIHSKESEFTMNTRLDQLMILVRSFPDYFGV